MQPVQNGGYSGYASVVLRVVIGLILFWHGQAKILNLAGTGQFFAGIGLPAASLLAFLAAAIETFGGAFLVLGILTRLSAFLVAVEFIVAVLLKLFMMRLPFVDFQTSVGGYQFDLLILAAAVSLLLGGSHKLSIDSRIFRRKSRRK